MEALEDAIKKAYKVVNCSRSLMPVYKVYSELMNRCFEACFYGYKARYIEFKTWHIRSKLDVKIAKLSNLDKKIAKKIAKLRGGAK